MSSDGLMFPKQPKKKKRMVHPKSIMQRKGTGICYLCAKLNQDFRFKDLEEHHVMYGSGMRKLSEQYGLKVYLCIYHHRYGPEAVHNNKEIRIMLCKEAKEAFEHHYPGKSWVETFGKDY